MSTYLHPASSTQVEKEKWYWVADYGNEQLKQFDDTEVFHNFAEIDQTRLQSFHMCNDETKQTVTILFPTSSKLIHFYRTAVLNDGAQTVRLYCFGYENSKNDCKVVIAPDDEVIFTDDFNKIGVSL